MRLTWVCLWLIFLASPAWAAAQSHGRYQDWRVYSAQTGDGKICFVASKPKQTGPRALQNQDIYLRVSTWQRGAKEQPSLGTSQILREDKKGEARIGRLRVPFYARGDSVYVEAGIDEQRLVRAMKKGSTMQIRYETGENQTVMHIFSLKGITAALRKANTLCGR